MQCPMCCHVMAFCHEDKQIFYFKCKHSTCVAAGMKCKYCDYVKLTKKGCIKNIKYNMLKHYTQNHLASSHTTKQVISCQHMVECNSTISTKSKSKSNECTTIISTSSYIDSSTNSYQYYHFEHFDSQPNQMYFFLNMFHPFLGGVHGIIWCAMTCTGTCTTKISTVEATQVFLKIYNQFQQASSKHHINLMNT